MGPEQLVVAPPASAPEADGLKDEARVPGAFARGLERALAAKHSIELRGDDAEDESDGAAEEDIDDDFDDDEDA